MILKQRDGEVLEISRIEFILHFVPSDDQGLIVLFQKIFPRTELKILIIVAVVRHNVDLFAVLTAHLTQVVGHGHGFTLTGQTEKAIDPVQMDRRVATIADLTEQQIRKQKDRFENDAAQAAGHRCRSRTG